LKFKNPSQPETQILKRFRLLKPLTRAELVATSFTPETTKIHILLSIDDDDHDYDGFLNDFEQTFLKPTTAASNMVALFATVTQQSDLRIVKHLTDLKNRYGPGAIDLLTIDHVNTNEGMMKAIDHFGPAKFYVDLGHAGAKVDLNMEWLNRVRLNTIVGRQV